MRNGIRNRVDSVGLSNYLALLVDIEGLRIGTTERTKILHHSVLPEKCSVLSGLTASCLESCRLRTRPPESAVDLSFSRLVCWPCCQAGNAKASESLVKQRADILRENKLWKFSACAAHSSRRIIVGGSRINRNRQICVELAAVELYSIANDFSTRIYAQHVNQEQTGICRNKRVEVDHHAVLPE